MRTELSEALDAVDMTYGEIVEISNEILSPIFSPINELVAELNDNVNSFTVDQIRGYIIRLQLKAYEISETKDKSALKSEISTAIKKEAYAEKFNGAVGAVAVKENTALTQIKEQVIVESLYRLVSDLLKTKLDQLHRLVDSLKSVLMSRMQEAKLIQNSIE